MERFEPAGKGSRRALRTPADRRRLIGTLRACQVDRTLVKPGPPWSRRGAPVELHVRLAQAIGSEATVERELGGGGMARVFLVTDRALGRRIVAKLLAPGGDTAIDASRFRREVKVTATLQHPHIVPLLTTGEFEGVPFYTMPYVEGRSLLDYDGRRLTWFLVCLSELGEERGDWRAASRYATMLLDCWVDPDPELLPRAEAALTRTERPRRRD